jgi:hypothetical protein
LDDAGRGFARETITLLLLFVPPPAGWGTQQ